MTVADRRSAFPRAPCPRDQLFVMPNPWDVGSARLLAAQGFEALATTSAGFAWALGKLDGQVTRAELVDHVASLAAATELPLNVDSERCFPSDPGGVAETVRLLGDAGAAGCSIEDWDPVAGRIDDVGLAAERVAEAAEAAHALDEPMVLTGRAENHLRGVDDLDDTIARLVAYRDAGADCLYAPALTRIDQIAAVVEAVGAPLNVLALPVAPSIPELAAGRRAPRLDRQPRRGRRVRRARRRGARAARRGNLALRGGAALGRGPAGRVRVGARARQARRPYTPRGTSSSTERRTRSRIEIIPITLSPSTTGRWRKPPWIISAAAWPTVSSGPIVSGARVIASATGPSTPPVATARRTSRSVRMPTRRPPSVTTTAPTRRSCMRPAASTRLVAGPTASTSGDMISSTAGMERS